MKSNKIITVYTSQNQTDHIMVQSILEGQGIKFFTKNENLQNLFGVGQFSTGYNPITGPMEIQVHPQDVEIAKTVIKDYLGNERSVKGMSYSEGSEEIDNKTVNEYNHCLNAAIIIGLVIPPLNLYHLLKAILIKNNSHLNLDGGFKLTLASLLSLFGLFILIKFIV
ncbi:MAG: hypothetical protein D8M58_20270 [Calditrichaeota bacterium]|nr:MAG: hypothetical protein DWQ03_14255 [Calditrichota bacterium]MBL1207747.1 hypothetical protein [Calditrichota bacterium]NOG47581.1 DUF2007 domain-containing protein [Calditrichota bacterium]